MTGPTAESQTAPVSPTQPADEKPTAIAARNPYGFMPSGRITLPPYYRPTPYLKSNNVSYTCCGAKEP